MTIALRVTDGATTVTLSSGNARLAEYVPRTPDLDRDEATRATADGGEQFAATLRNVTETAHVIFVTGNANARSDIATLGRLFEQARRYQRLRIGSAVYVEFRPDASEDYYRSEILAGRVVLDDAATDWQFTAAKIQATIFWTRRFYWEGPEAQIPLTNGNGANNLTGLTVYNHDDADAGHDNYVAIAAADVAGDLPAPLRIEATNTYNDANRAANFYAAHNYRSDPANLTHILEAESATGGTTTASSGCSGGYYKALSWAATTETQLLEWDLGTALLNACAGNYFRALIRLASSYPYDDLWLRLKIKLALTAVWEGSWALAKYGLSLFELSSFQLPPYLLGAGDLYPLKLTLYGKRNVSGTHNLAVDFLQLSPLDGWRRWQPKGYNLAYEARIVDDMIAGYLYTDGWTSAGKTGHYIGFGEPIRLIPNKAQRLYFLWDGDTGDSDIERTLSVKAYYRPRRMTI